MIIATHVARSLVLAAVVGVGVVAASVERAEACSCAAPGEFGLLDPGPEVPVGTRGLLWIGHGKVRPSDFTITATSAAGKRTRVPVVLEVVGAFDDDMSRWNVVLVKPRRPLAVGVTYRFTTRRVDRHREPAGAQREVKVAQGVVAVPASLALTVGAAAQADLDIVSLAGDCGRTARVSQAPVEVVLPPSLQPYRQQLLYRTMVDGKPWRPRRSMCSTVAPGRSWQPRAGTDLLFSSCEVDEDQVGLTAGEHQVVVEVSVPTLAAGAVVRTAPVKVQLGCTTPPVGPAPRPPPRP